VTSDPPRLTLRGDVVLLEEFSEEHLEDDRYLSWLRDVDLLVSIGRPEYLLPGSADQIREQARVMMLNGTDRFFAIRSLDSQEFVGTFKIGHINWRTGVGDVGIIIGEHSARGKGFSTDALRTGCGFALGPLGLRRLTGGTTETNVAMIRCFERVGFKREGVLRKHDVARGVNLDHVLFGLLREEFVSSDATRT